MASAVSFGSTGESHRLRDNRNWLKIWTGRAALTLGDQIFATSLTLWVGAILADGRSWGPSAISAILLSSQIPPILFSLAAGTFVDRWDKRHVMIATTLASAATCLALMLVLSLDIPTAPLLVTVCCAVSCLSIGQQFFGPANLSTVYEVVPASKRTEAIGKLLTSTQIIVMIGPPLAAPLLFNLGMQGSILVDLVAFGLACALALRLRLSPPPSEIASSRRLRAQFLEAIQFIRDVRVLRVALGTFCFFCLGASATTAVSYFYITQRLHCSPSVVGAFGTLIGVGAIAGSFIARKRVSAGNFHYSYAIGLLSFGALAFLYSLSGNIVNGGVIYFLWGVTYGVISYSLEAIAATTVPKELIGRVSSCIAPMQGIAAVIGFLVGGFFAHQGLSGANIVIASLSLDPLRSVYGLVALLTFGAGCYAAWRFRGVRLEHVEDGESSTEVEGHAVVMPSATAMLEKKVAWNIRSPFL